MKIVVGKIYTVSEKIKNAFSLKGDTTKIVALANNIVTMEVDGQAFHLKESIAVDNLKELYNSTARPIEDVKQEIVESETIEVVEDEILEEDDLEDEMAEDEVTENIVEEKRLSIDDSILIINNPVDKQPIYDLDNPDEGFI